tara:strand:+ start:178 stop:441 length:264 start_codon:yes stop_codon:yes gene_type:complete
MLLPAPADGSVVPTRLLVEEAEDLTSGVLPPRLLVVHDAIASRQNNVAELARRQQVDDPLLDLVVATVEARRDDAALVDASDELNNL